VHLFSPQVYLKYDFERTVEPVAKINTVPFGKSHPCPFAVIRLGTENLPRLEARTGVLVVHQDRGTTYITRHLIIGCEVSVSALNVGGVPRRARRMLSVTVWLCHTVRAEVSHTERTHIWAAVLVHTHMAVLPQTRGGGGGTGAKMTVEDLLATQTRIESQEKAHCVSCSFDANAANVFQAYVRGTLQFAVERVGFMFGTVDEAGAVKVEFIYEPPQEATATSTMLMRDAQEEKAVHFIAAQLGCARHFHLRCRSPFPKPQRTGRWRGSFVRSCHHLVPVRAVWLRVCDWPHLSAL
jgi:hypothetical protein